MCILRTFYLGSDVMIMVFHYSALPSICVSLQSREIQSLDPTPSGTCMPSGRFENSLPCLFAIMSQG